MLFEDRTKGSFAARFRRPKKNKSSELPLADSTSSSPSSSLSLSSSSEWENLDNKAEPVALPSLPARPSFPVDPVAHARKPMTSLGELAQCYDSQALSPLSLDDDIEMEDVYLVGYGLENGVRWPKLHDEEQPTDFTRLLDDFPAAKPVSPISSVCPTTLMDEKEGDSELVDGLSEFLDQTDRVLGEWVSYCDTFVQMDPDEACPFF